MKNFNTLMSDLSFIKRTKETSRLAINNIKTLCYYDSLTAVRRRRRSTQRRAPRLRENKTRQAYRVRAVAWRTGGGGHQCDHSLTSNTHYTLNSMYTIYSL